MFIDILFYIIFYYLFICIYIYIFNYLIVLLFIYLIVLLFNCVIVLLLQKRSQLQKRSRRTCRSYLCKKGTSVENSF